MKPGKVSESVLKRSILKKIESRREEILVGAMPGGDCAVLQEDSSHVTALSTQVSVLGSRNQGKLAVYLVANNLAATGAEPVGVSLSLILPERGKESQIKNLMDEAEHTCRNLNMQIIGGHTEISGAVIRPVVTATGVGRTGKDQWISIADQELANKDIVVTKWIGLEGTFLLAWEKEQELLERYPVYFIDEAKQYDQYLSVLSEAATAVKSGASAMHNLSGGGIFGALWEMADSAGVGLEIDLKKLPVKQATIEICEYFDLNPYMLRSNGSMIIVTEHGYDLVRELQEKNINAVVVGRTTEGNDRVVRNGGETRFLEPAKSDEIHKVL